MREAERTAWYWVIVYLHLTGGAVAAVAILAGAFFFVRMEHAPLAYLFSVGIVGIFWAAGACFGNLFIALTPPDPPATAIDDDDEHEAPTAHCPF